ncbi:hypothetical protein CEXT_376671 [Caerostris extrusa]|uniref:Ycf15 n=1 Tax=Caerostris extrusa TaxID=172846 RepID=A0AAV4NRC6_CAEEX|nr:hypothetical protein CEXT_376671 [Caerostris extrusa]
MHMLGSPRDLFKMVRSPFSIDCGLSNDPSKETILYQSASILNYQETTSGLQWIGRGEPDGLFPHGHPI